MPQRSNFSQRLLTERLRYAGNEVLQFQRLRGKAERLSDSFQRPTKVYPRTIPALAKSVLFQAEFNIEHLRTKAAQ